MAKQCLDNVPSSRPEVASILHTLQKIDFDMEDYENKRLNVIEAFTMLAHKVIISLFFLAPVMYNIMISYLLALRKRMNYRNSIN